MTEVVYIARCPVHGLHGERDLLAGVDFMGTIQLVGDELHLTAWTPEWDGTRAGAQRAERPKPTQTSAPVSAVRGGDVSSGGEGSIAPDDPTADADEPGSGEGGDTAAVVDRDEGGALTYVSEPLCENPVDRGTYALRCGDCAACRMAARSPDVSYQGPGDSA